VVILLYFSIISWNYWSKIRQISVKDNKFPEAYALNGIYGFHSCATFILKKIKIKCTRCGANERGHKFWRWYHTIPLIFFSITSPLWLPVSCAGEFRQINEVVVLSVVYYYSECLITKWNSLIDLHKLVKCCIASSIFFLTKKGGLGQFCKWCK